MSGMAQALGPSSWCDWDVSSRASDGNQVLSFPTLHHSLLGWWWGDLLALPPQRSCTHSDKNTTVSRKMELLFLSPFWQEAKVIWEEARDMNVSLFVEIMPHPSTHRTQALGDL